MFSSASTHKIIIQSCYRAVTKLLQNCYRAERIFTFYSPKHNNSIGGSGRGQNHKEIWVKIIHFGEKEDKKFINLR